MQLLQQTKLLMQILVQQDQDGVLMQQVKKVEFIAWNAASRTGTYSLSGSSIGGSFVRTVAGRTPQESFTPQTGWNIDGYNGTGKV